MKFNKTILRCNSVFNSETLFEIHNFSLTKSFNRESNFILHHFYIFVITFLIGIVNILSSN